MMVDRSEGYYKSNDIFKEFGEKGFFDLNYDNKNKTIIFPNDINSNSNRKTGMKGTFCKYGECCIYQYSNIEGNEADFENMYQRIKNDLIFADSIMKENNSQPYKEKSY